MSETRSLQLTPPSLPSGGGAISGLKGDIATAGPDGAATLSIPLPLSTGRGYAPTLTLGYHSRSGNGPFGMGWGVNQPAIRRRTVRGAPSYDGTDEYIGLDGEVLAPALTASGKPETRMTTTLLGVNLAEPFTVNVYRSRTETTFSRTEHWVPEGGSGTDFWVTYEPDGQVHLLGRTPQARIVNPADASQTAVWLTESSVSPAGEQIYWQYRAEDETDCDTTEKTAHPDATAQRYPIAVWYGNKKAGRTLPALTDKPENTDWLFILVMDYGERDNVVASAPQWTTPGSGNWLCRQDCFSGYEYGFEVRTRRLCRQVLMFHRITALSGEEKENDSPQLVSCLRLEYNEMPSVTTLKRAQQMAYETDGKVRSLPPLTFGWQGFTPPGAGAADWQQRNDLVNLPQPYQLVDLDGEGIVGILYQDGGGWWYRAPVRQAGDDPDAVTWNKATLLPSIPALREGGILADLNGDGCLEWIVTAPGTSGCYQRTPGRGWLPFTPLSALPVEFASPHARLVDITGSGLADLALIGPKSVRFYAGLGDGWMKAQNTLQSAGITLPVPGSDARILVAFSDMAGSGQQHLVEVRAAGVRYWPSLGHGRFGLPVSLPGFSQPVDTFNPEQLYLADLDGSGTTDLIYALSDRLDVYINQSGNCFSRPFSVNLPDGVRYDHTCSLQLADIQGLGVASLVLTVPNPVPRSWVCHLSGDKPWLLSGMNNGMGANHDLSYRSSAQFWLDEKEEVADKSDPVSWLPFALHMLSRTEVTDEITGNRLISTACYRHGAWDGREREFRGFGLVEVSDAETVAGQGGAGNISFPAVSRSWYATGVPAVDALLPNGYWKGDTAAFTGFPLRFTTGCGDDEQECTPDDTTTFWLNRGLKGLLLRTELYGADESRQAGVPYTVTENRPQVRLVVETGTYPVVWPSVVESRTYVYERVSNDPQCSQQVLLSRDEYGQPLRQVSISYPRRRQTSTSYPDILPEGLFAASFDEQQLTLCLTLQQTRWHTLKDVAAGVWLPGLADASRSDVITLTESDLPAGGLTLEFLLGSGSPVGDRKEFTFAGQQQIRYLDAQGHVADGTPAFPPLPAFSETAVIDENTWSSLSDNLPPDALMSAGYRQSGYLFPRMGESDRTLWTVRQGYASYATAEHFWLPVSFRENLLTGTVRVFRDAYDCVITKQKDSAGLITTVQYDWRFLIPESMTDANGNVRAVTMDALGRVTSLRFSGTERGVAVGYSDAAVDIPEDADTALALAAPLSLAQCLVYVSDSWTRDNAEKLPPHVVTLTTDRYDSDNAQQIRQQVTFNDGFGRLLQVAVRQADGEAWQRADNGSLVTGSDGAPATMSTTSRWAVTGRAEYDNKGQKVRSYQPYFLNSWKYVSDDSARQDLYADIHFYDPVGREYMVLTAKGWLRRSLYTPWFVMSEDENNTADETNQT
ncbi:SpvB/TcaC N-terminal domain-containing protein [Serratia liquefaciens]|uniref:Virulence protein n=1 Tax=Serratia liquefaciens TaxID=614 RepID=A0A515D5L2_SERLI|nr:SpvB/TcaC N-terminal domain-containing protein [Serratia liquefaciens]QDL35695.1 virulence protein [Serratia liquefaciens]